MRKTILAVLHVWLKAAEKGRAAGIEHFAVAVLTGLLTFLNINQFQQIFGLKPWLTYTHGAIYYLI
jgi:hypothetical protein